MASDNSIYKDYIHYTRQYQEKYGKQCIVLLQDCQVTGGYPRILQLSEVAMARISQKIAGDIIQFVLED